MLTPIRKAIFPVGGLGTRFLPATKALPKEMLPVASKPLIQHAFEEAVEAGIEQFIFITGRNKNAISNHFDHSYELQRILSDKQKEEALAMSKDWLPTAGNIAFVRQQEPLGLGHAVWCARNFISNDEPFAVLLADDLFFNHGNDNVLKQMVDSYHQTGGNLIAVSEIEPKHTNRYGVIAPANHDGKNIKINHMVEKPTPEEAPSNIAISGRYILQPGIFDYLAKQKTGSGGEIQLTDAMDSMLREGAHYHGVLFEGERFDCGSRIGFLEANIALSLARDDLRDSVLDILRKYSTLTE